MYVCTCIWLYCLATKVIVVIYGMSVDDHRIIWLDALDNVHIHVYVSHASQLTSCNHYVCTYVCVQCMCMYVHVLHMWYRPSMYSSDNP